MKKTGMKIELMEHTSFLGSDGKLDKAKVIDYSGKAAGECYETEGWDKLSIENPEKTQKRVNSNLFDGHQSPYEHPVVGMNMINIPKILAIVLNSERQNATSERSFRFTKVSEERDLNITDRERNLYNKWMKIFEIKIQSLYGNVFDETRVKRLCQENSRYLMTVFLQTQMIHTVPWIQLNKIVSYMNDYINKQNKTEFEERLSLTFVEFIEELDSLNVLDERAMRNIKHRKLGLFANREVETSYGDSYSVNYKGSFVLLADHVRHRRVEYGMLFPKEKNYYIPEILKDEPALVEEWLSDMASVDNLIPQGQIISINDCGTYNTFIDRLKDRVCSDVQLEIQNINITMLNEMYAALVARGSDLTDDLKKYMNGAKCTFGDYDCPRRCNFKEGINLTRRV